MWLWLIIIHIAELAIIGIVLLIRRNNALEKAVIEQQQYMDAISILISSSQQQLNELDQLGAFKADDEVGTFFNNLKEIQENLNRFNTRR
jgi:uncharacterized protein YpmS